MTHRCFMFMQVIISGRKKMPAKGCSCNLSMKASISLVQSNINPCLHLCVQHLQSLCLGLWVWHWTPRFNPNFNNIRVATAPQSADSSHSWLCQWPVPDASEEIAEHHHTANWWEQVLLLPAGVHQLCVLQHWGLTKIAMCSASRLPSIRGAQTAANETPPMSGIALLLSVDCLTSGDEEPASWMEIRWLQSPDSINTGPDIWRVSLTAVCTLLISLMVQGKSAGSCELMESWELGVQHGRLQGDAPAHVIRVKRKRGKLKTIKEHKAGQNVLMAGAHAGAELQTLEPEAELWLNLPVSRRWTVVQHKLFL